MLTFLKEKIGKRPIGKALKEMFTEEFLLEVNWDGANGRICINKFALFNKFLFDALKDEYATYEEYIKAMKKAFFENKAAPYRKTYKQKTKRQQQK